MFPLIGRLLRTTGQLLVIAVAFGVSLPVIERGGACANETATSAKPELSRWIDSQFQRQFYVDGARPEIVDDATFLRRIYLDLAGRIPAVAEVRDFLDDLDSLKRRRVIDRLLASERYPEHFARVWRRILISPRPGAGPPEFFESWLKEQMAQNIPYDKIVRQLVTAGGAESGVEQTHGTGGEPSPVPGDANLAPLAYLAATGGQPAEIIGSVSRVFLGSRLECAQCHDHPFSHWTQQDFWGGAAFFAGVGVNRATGARPPNASDARPIDARVTVIADEDGNTYGLMLPANKRVGQHVETELAPGQLPRAYFANWLASPANHQFSATAVNRIWQQLCGTGLTPSVDDLDRATPAEREMLDGLASQFAANGFNIKELIRAICSSDTYQRTSDPDQSQFGMAGRPLKVATPEQLFDSLEMAVGLPISRIDQGPRYNGLRQSLIGRMEESVALSPCEFRSGIPQFLLLMNGQITTDAVDLNKSRTLRAIVDAPFLDVREKTDALFLTTLTRRPTDSEAQSIMETIKSKSSDKEKAEAISAMMWALINSPEFVLIR